VPDVNHAARWYVDVLNLQVVHQFRDKLVIVGGSDGCQLGLEWGKPVSEPDRIHFIFRVEDVDDLCRRLQARTDVKILFPPADQPYGHRVMSISDPVGHTVELYTPLAGERPYD